jgi:hypothetical protein
MHVYNSADNHQSLSTFERSDRVTEETGEKNGMQQEDWYRRRRLDYEDKSEFEEKMTHDLLSWTDNQTNGQPTESHGK